jgi:hypothetical protein
MMDALFGVFIGICIMLIIDGYRAQKEYQRSRDRFFEETDKYQARSVKTEKDIAKNDAMLRTIMLPKPSQRDEYQ